MATNVFDSVRDSLGDELIISNSEASEARALFIEDVSKMAHEAILRFIRTKCIVPATATKLTVAITNIGITTDALYVDVRGQFDSGVSFIQEMKLFEILSGHLFVDSHFETPLNTLRDVTGLTPDRIQIRTDADLEFGTISLSEIFGDKFTTDFPVVAPPDTDESEKSDS